jgi:hypothetical protein
MAICNSHSGQKKYSVSNYEAVFGQKYHPTLLCSLADIRKCQSISQRPRMSPDERLEKYVQENNIVDIDVDEVLLVSHFDEDKECEEEFDRMNPPMELDDAAFPDSQVYDEEDDNNVGSHHGAVTTYAQGNNLVVVGVRPTSQDIPAMQQDILPPSFQENVAMQLNIRSQTFQGEVSNSVSLSAPKAAPPGPDRTMTGSLCTKQNVPNKHLQTFCVSEYLTFTLQQAWDNRNIARNHSILSGQQRIEYKFLFPTLTCGECYFPHAKTLLSVGDSDYLIPTDQPTGGMTACSFQALHNWRLIPRTLLLWND